MTFAAKIKLHAGLPSYYLLAVTLFIFCICLFLSLKAFRSELSWLWVACMTGIAVIVLFRFYIINKAQQSLFLFLDSDTSVLRLFSDPIQNSDGMLVTHSRFVRQTQSLLFASLEIADGGKRNIVFHKGRNDKAMFRRFGVHEKWGQINTENFTATDSKTRMHN